MILYFKHIIHIDDFPLNGHPPSAIINAGISGQCRKLIYVTVINVTCFSYGDEHGVTVILCS